MEQAALVLQGGSLGTVLHRRGSDSPCGLPEEAEAQLLTAVEVTALPLLAAGAPPLCESLKVVIASRF